MKFLRLYLIFIYYTGKAKIFLKLGKDTCPVLFLLVPINRTNSPVSPTTFSKHLCEVDGPKDKLLLREIDPATLGW